MTSINDRSRIDALRQAVTEGAQLIHNGVETVAVQDAARPIYEPELQPLARGVEVLGKAAWMMNDRIITGSWRSARRYGHRLVQLLGALDGQARDRHQDPVLVNPVVLRMMEVLEDFADGGRFRHLDGLASGTDFPPPYLAWNCFQNETLVLGGKQQMEQAERSAYLRTTHTESLQRLERALARHLVTAQRDLWGGTIVCREWLDSRTRRLDSELSDPIALDFRFARCACAVLDRRISVWAPISR
ncbi:MAG TPA: hypothetical protein VM287_15695 [Egibacteraceae bacterium]|nr:hypothetical protein [Egibacteraceae bacterium]